MRCADALERRGQKVGSFDGYPPNWTSRPAAPAQLFHCLLILSVWLGTGSSGSTGTTALALGGRRFWRLGRLRFARHDGKYFLG